MLTNTLAKKQKELSKQQVTKPRELPILLANIKIMRPSQWVKNLIVFIPLFFSGSLFSSDYFLRTFFAFIALCLLSSSIYIINDVVDKDRDKSHPTKQFRPIASGQIPVLSALLLAVGIFILSLFIGIALLSSEYFFLLQLAYFMLMLLYSVWLKNIVIIDTIVISLGFILRALIGAIIVQIPVSAMLVLTIIGASLLMSFGKRRAEISIMTRESVIKYRPVMNEYPPLVLDLILAGLFAITFMSYTLFSYGYSGFTLDPSLAHVLPPLLRNSRWLLVTVPIAFYALARYLLIVYRSDVAEHPENLWLKDRGLFIALLIWFLVMYFLIYIR
jgi:4-hydroxybenzoate polyprenyltransferase